jgi:outer membrane receptor protein involved in Fe transport
LWRAPGGDVLKAIYSQGFRAPTAAEAFYRDGTDYLDNPGLRPEVVDAFELSWDRRAGPAQLQASAFASHYQRLIRFSSVQVSGPPGSTDATDFRQVGQNQGSLWSGGAQLSARLRWGRWLQGYGGFSAQAIAPDGRTNFPALTASLALSTRALWDPLSLALSATLVGARRKDQSALDQLPPGSTAARVGPALQLAAHAVLEVPGLPGLSLDLGVVNLLGAAAPDPLSGDSIPLTALQQAPRTFRAGLRWDFDRP